MLADFHSSKPLLHSGEIEGSVTVTMEPGGTSGYPVLLCQCLYSITEADDTAKVTLTCTGRLYTLCLLHEFRHRASLHTLGSVSSPSTTTKATLM